MDIIEKLARNVIETKYEDLPEEAVAATKKGILDTLGCLIGGASECRKEVELVREWGGKPESSVLVYGDKVPAANAAWVNSDMAYALDYDGGGGAGPLHDLVCTVPTALAAGEARGGINGRELITAVATGEDLAIRIFHSSRNIGGFSAVGVVMVFGTAAIAARILGLDLEDTMNALGFAFVRGAGSHQVASDKVSALRMLAGFSSCSGIEAAMLARKGLTGVRNILQGYHGYFKLFPQDGVDLNVLTGELGKRFEVTRVHFKFYPSCGTTHAATEAALRLVQENEIDPKGISRVTVASSELNHSGTGHPLTFGLGDTPEAVEGQFSQPYTIANAIIRKSSKLEHFTLKYMQDPDVIELANKVFPVASPEIEEDITALVKIEMKDGRQYSRLVRASETRKLSSAGEVKAKFRECTAFAPMPLPRGNPEKIIEMVDNLEKVEDTSELIKLLIRN